MACTALTIGGASAFAANADTQYDVVATESPDPGFNSRFAERLSAASDLTGDGVPDIFASTWVQDVAATEAGGVVDNNAGRLSLINGATQKVVYKTTPEPQGPGPGENPASAGGNFGFYISVAGDVNGDRKEDIVSGASGYDVYTGSGPQCGQPEPNGCNENQGRGYVLSGPTGEVIRKLDNPNPQASGGFASRLGAAGDVNGDGVPDLLVAAPSNDFPAGCGIAPNGQPYGNANADFPSSAFPDGCRANEGEVFVVDGKTFGLIRTLRIPDTDVKGPTCGSPPRPPIPPKTTPEPPATPACGSLGGGPQNVGDLTGDRVPDFQVPATGYDPDPTRDGRIYVYNGATGAVLIRIDQPDPDTSAFFGLGDLERGGAGDLNADGVPELYGTGFIQDGPGGTSAGRSWVFDGKRSLAAGTGVLLREYIDPFVGPSRAFGWGLSQTDYNKDGRVDSYVSNLQSQNTTTTIFDGRDGSVLKNLVLPPSEAQAPQAGNNGSSLGWSSRAPGDLNADGEPDYVAAAPYTDVSGSQDQGKVYFFLSNVPKPPAPPAPAPGGTPPAPAPGGTPPAPAPGGGSGAGARARILPNMVRPGGSARQSRRKIVASVRGRLIGAQGRSCSGRVKVGVRFARNRRVNRVTRMGSNCRYTVRVAFPVRRVPRSLRPRGKTLVLRVAARFQGNAGLRTDVSPTKRMKVRR